MLVAVYARFSTTLQDARSIEDQLRRCGRFAKERGWTVTAEFSDAAQSGATLDRAGLQRLLASADARPRPFDAVLVDDLSRLSRDAGHSWRIVFEDLAGRGVELYDCTTGMSSQGPGARLMFGALGLVNDTFLQLVKAETHRGLEGRALAGFATGGRCYGYATRPEDNPPDPTRPRSVIYINEAEARTVRRTFEAYASGSSLRDIAHRLNASGIRAPYDERGYLKPNGRGWSAVTLSSMLRNERYRGRLVWNKRRFQRTPTGTRVLFNPKDKWVVHDRPDLRIIDDGLWSRVQTRLSDHRKLGSPKSRHRRGPLSGLVVCAACGSRFAISGQKRKGSRVYRNLRCSANVTRGQAICTNWLAIGEQKLVSAIAHTIRGTVDQFWPEFERAFRTEWAAAAASLASTTPSAELDEEVGRLTARVDRLTDLLADNGDVEAILRRLRAEEAKLRELRERRDALAAPKGSAPPPPSAERVRAYFEDVAGTLVANPEDAREALAAAFSGITLRPVGRSYRLELEMATAAPVEESGRRRSAVSPVAGAGFEPATFGL
jgi:DNA invertase Pin-like site-specific DNA recombinase